MAATLEASPIGGPDIGVKIGVTEPVLLPSSLPDSITADKSRSAEGGRFLVSSPYPFPPHLLDLSALTASQSLLAEALGSMEAVRPDYATAPYDAAFNWDTVMDKLRSLASTRNFQWPHQYFYIVVFRSRIPDTSVRAELGRLDEKSHTEANQSGGLLKYWFGVPDAEGRNLATCKTPILTLPEELEGSRATQKDVRTYKDCYRYLASGIRRTAGELRSRSQSCDACDHEPVYRVAR